MSGATLPLGAKFRDMSVGTTTRSPPGLEYTIFTCTAIAVSWSSDLHQVRVAHRLCLVLGGLFEATSSLLYGVSLP